MWSKKKYYEAGPLETYNGTKLDNWDLVLPSKIKNLDLLNSVQKAAICRLYGWSLPLGRMKAIVVKHFLSDIMLMEWKEVGREALSSTPVSYVQNKEWPLILVFVHTSLNLVESQCTLYWTAPHMGENNNSS